MPFPKHSLSTPIPRLMLQIIPFTNTADFSFLLCPLPRLPLIVHMCLIQLSRFHGFRMQIPSPSPPRSAALSFANPRETFLILRLPLLESSAAIRSRELYAALGFDELDVVGPNAIALDELFLLLVPSYMFPPLVFEEGFVPREVKRSVASLFDE